MSITHNFQSLQTTSTTLRTKTLLQTEVAIAAIHVSMIIQSPVGQVPILKDITLNVRNGSVHLLMGPSGAGKTTLLLVLSGLLSPTSGRVLLLGEDITNLSRRQQERFRLQHTGFVAQDFNLFPALTAIENVLFALALKGIRGKTARQSAQHLLEQVGLAEKANHLPRELSGGQQQRVAIARALANHPQLIMADEPTASLDSHSGHAVMELLHNLTREQSCTVLMVTHDSRIVGMADQVTKLEDGMISAAHTYQNKGTTNEYSDSHFN